MSQYAFSLVRFQIMNTMSGHNDTDYVYFTLVVGTQKFQHFAKIGDLNSGNYLLGDARGYQFAADVDLTDNVIMTYQIVNNGHDDEVTQTKNAIKIADTIQQAVASAVSAFPPAAGIAAIISAALSGIGDAVNWLTGKINCDGVVLSDVITTTGSELAQKVDGIIDWTECPTYIGPDTPAGCGSNASYAVQWAIQQYPIVPFHRPQNPDGPTPPHHMPF